MNFYGNGEIQFMVDFDGHGYLNHASRSSKNWNAEHHFEHEMDVENYGLPHFFSVSLSHDVDEATLSMRNTPGAHGLYASKDIQPGEEICFDYEEVHMDGLFDYYTFVVTQSLPMQYWLTI